MTGETPVRSPGLPGLSVLVPVHNEAATIEGALASSRAARPPLVDQQRCFILATNERDETLLAPKAL